MTKNKTQKPYDLEDRTLEYAKSVRAFIKNIPKTLSKKDFLYRIKLCRKEAKESRFWIELLDTEHDDTSNKQKKSLANETTELMKIFGSIVTKSQ